MSTAAPAPGQRARGLLLGLAAYGWWGFFPIYLKAVGTAPVLEVLSHRILWALVFLLAIGARMDLPRAVGRALQDGRTLRVLAASTVLIALNWSVYIWAVVHGRMVEASLGYYVNPLVNVLLGVAILGERLAGPVKVAVGIAALGVLWLAATLGALPWISLSLAVTFGLYGLMRKIAPVGALVGLTVETALLLPLAAAYLAWSVHGGHAAFLARSRSFDLLLLLAGPLTAIPLLCFAGATRRLPLSTIGFLQYLSPTIQFLLAVLLYREPFDRRRAVAFFFIWTALLVFAVHSARRHLPEPATDA